MANPTVNAGADSLPSDEPRYRFQAHSALQQDVYESLMAYLDEEIPAAELVERLSAEIRPSDFKLLLSSPRLMAVFHDVMTACGVSVRSGRGVRIRDAVAEVLYEDEVLAQIKAHVVDRPQTGLGASAPDPRSTPGRSGDRHFEGSDLTSREREAEAKRLQQVSQRFPEVVKYTVAPDADLAKVLGKMRDCITHLSLSPAESRKYAHNLFTDDAKRFFDDDQDIKTAATLDRVIELMSERYLVRRLNFHRGLFGRFADCKSHEGG